MKLSSSVDDKITFSGDTIGFCPGNTATVELTCEGFNVTELWWISNEGLLIDSFNVQDEPPLYDQHVVGPYTVYLDRNTRINSETSTFITITSRLTVMTANSTRLSSDHHNTERIECRAYKSRQFSSEDSMIIDYNPIGKLARV